ncbi:hypothetical protein BDV93DRAFT_563979 [Ceratobasidium sp. AG-I]|nr:hypothetical protein BDV93DRAFT_563979 [Ceratobasidium sp. AG-I]
MKLYSLLSLVLATPALAIFQLGCGEACNGVIDGFELECTPGTKQHHGTSLDLAHCQAQNAPYLSTIAWCIASRCTAASQKEILHYWDWVQGNRKIAWPSYASVLPSVEPPLVSEDLEILNSTVRISDDSYWLEYGTQQTFSYVERWHVRTGYILIILVVVACLFGAAQWLVLTKLYAPHASTSWRSSSTVTWFKKHLVLPALFNASHRQPILRSLGYLPTRLAALLLFIFFALNIIFLAVGIKSIQPNTWYTSRKMEINNYVANRAGVLSFALLPLTVLLSARNNPLVRLTNMTATTYVMVHRWVARACAFQAVVHSVGWTLQWYWEKGDWSTLRAEGTLPYMRWGFAGTVALCLMVGLAAWPIRHRSYELFIVLHIALGIISLAGCWYHMDFRFANKYGYKNWLYVTFGIWGADRIVRSLRMLYLSWPAITRKPNALARAELLPGGTDLLKITIPTRLGLSAKPGQYAFVHFASLFKPWENHPFSIASWSVGGSDVERASPEPTKASSEDAEKESQTDSVPSFTPSGPSITMIVRAYNGATSRIRDAVRANRGPMTLPILLEGPYGHPQPLHVYETQVLIAGGVGVTAILGYIQAFVDSPSEMKTKRMVIVWSAREADFIRAVVGSSLSHLPENVKLQLHCTGSQASELDGKYAVTHARPQLPNVVKTNVENLPAGERVAFLVSGSGSMSDEVRQAVVECIGAGPGQVDGDQVNFFDEVFAW